MDIVLPFCRRRTESEGTPDYPTPCIRSGVVETESSLTIWWTSPGRFSDTLTKKVSFPNGCRSGILIDSNSSILPQKSHSSVERKKNRRSSTLSEVSPMSLSENPREILNPLDPYHKPKTGSFRLQRPTDHGRVSSTILTEGIREGSFVL